MNESIAFRFYTRTKSEDYRVFAGDGKEELNFAEEFQPILDIAQVDEDEKSAVIYEDSGKVYVAAFGLRLSRQDRARRVIKFSFCLILPSENLQTAMRAFSRVVNEWDETAECASRLIEEIPVMRKDWQGRNKPGEDMRFDQRKFLQWLVSKPASIQLPKAGYMKKYFADSGELIEIGSEDEEDSGEGYTYRWMIYLLVVGVVCVGLLMWYLMRENGQSKPQVQPQELLLKSQEEQSSQPENILPTSVEIKIREEMNGKPNSDDKGTGSRDISSDKTLVSRDEVSPEEKGGSTNGDN